MEFLRILPGFLDDLTEKFRVPRGGGDHQLTFRGSQRREKTSLIELRVADNTQLVKPAVPQVGASDGFCLLSGIPLDDASVTQGDPQVVLVMVDDLPGLCRVLDPGRSLETGVFHVCESWSAHRDPYPGLRQPPGERPVGSCQGFPEPSPRHQQPGFPVRVGTLTAASLSCLRIGEAMPRVIWRELLVVRLRLPWAGFRSGFHRENLRTQARFHLRGEFREIFSHTPPRES